MIKIRKKGIEIIQNKDGLTITGVRSSIVRFNSLIARKARHKPV
jgi:hypothetical protein